MGVKIELRDISTNERLSEETSCYSATLVVNGKVVGTTGNRGCGGGDEVNLKPGCGWTWPELEAAVKADYPAHDISYMYPGAAAGSHMMDASLETVCGEIVEKHGFEKKVKRAMKSKIVVLTGNKGEYRTYGWKGVKQITPAHLAAFAKSNPSIKPLNAMTPAEQDAAISAAFVG